MKASNFLNKLAKDAGVDLESDALKALLSAPELSEVEIPDEITTQITGQLMTVASAKNNPDIAKHFKGQYLQTVNRDLSGFLKDSGIGQERIDELSKEPDTLKRLRAGLAEYKQYIAANTSNDNNDETDKKIAELTGQINKLREEKAQEATSWQEKLTAQNTSFERERIEAIIQGKLGSYTFADTYPTDDVKVLVKSKIDSLPFLLKRVEGRNIEVFQKDNPEMKAFKDNEAIVFDGLIDEIVAPYLKKGNSDKTKTEKVINADKNKSSIFTFGGHQQIAT